MGSGTVCFCLVKGEEESRVSAGRSETIFALSSGRPPAGVAIVRLSGPGSLATLRRLTGVLPRPRVATLVTICDGSAAVIDKGLALAFPAPASFTGEDVVELHIHGGPAVIDALLGYLARQPGLRLAEPGEFSRRAFDNGKLDLSQAEGLADLIDARTEAQRVQALAQAGGRLRDAAERWRSAIVALMAAAEAGLDFADEADVGEPWNVVACTALRDEIAGHLARASVGERLRDGFVIAVVGEPNVGKSSFVNALAKRDVAIVSPIPGTTRDLIEVALDLGGVAATLVDTAGLRESADPVEAEGVARARARAADADLVLHLVDGPTNEHLGQPIRTKIDLADIARGHRDGIFHLSAHSGAGLAELQAWLVEWARAQVGSGEPALVSRQRQRLALERAVARLDDALGEADPVLRAESLRLAARALGELTGQVGVEDVLGSIFGSFCIGK